MICLKEVTAVEAMPVQISHFSTEAEAFTMWNAESNDLSKWERLRPDCWISTIPADGMILSPEGGGGCSCGSWLETSIAFAPKSRAPIMFDTKGKK